jgi:hypothetical protein
MDPGGRPKRVEVQERLEGREARASALMACGRAVVGVAGETEVEGSAEAVALGARVEARFAREGFTRGATVGASITELLGITSLRRRSGGTFPFPAGVPRAWADRKLERALFADADATYLATFAREDRLRTLQVTCVKQRCEVSVTEERTSCDEPGGTVMVDLSGDAVAP